MDHSLVTVKGLVQLNEAMSHAMQGHPRWMGHSEEFWQIVVHWKRKWQHTPVFLLWEPHEKYEKEKRYEAERWAPQNGRCPVHYCVWAGGNY